MISVGKCEGLFCYLSDVPEACENLAFHHIFEKKLFRKEAIGKSNVSGWSLAGQLK